MTRSSQGPVEGLATLAILVGLGSIPGCAPHTPVPEPVRAATTGQHLRVAILAWCRQPEHAADPTCHERVERAHCTAAGGRWRRFTNGCADSCGRLDGGSPMCTMDTPMACDCGASACWDGVRCVSNATYRSRPTPPVPRAPAPPLPPRPPTAAPPVKRPPAPVAAPDRPAPPPATTLTAAERLRWGCTRDADCVLSSRREETCCNDPCFAHHPFNRTFHRQLGARTCRKRCPVKGQVSCPAIRIFPHEAVCQAGRCRAQRIMRRSP